MPLSDDIEDFWKVVRPVRLPPVTTASPAVVTPSEPTQVRVRGPRFKYHFLRISISEVTKPTLSIAIATRVIQEPRSGSDYARFRVTAKDLMGLPREALVRLAVNLGLRLDELLLGESELPEMDTEFLNGA